MIARVLGLIGLGAGGGVPVAWLVAGAVVLFAVFTGSIWKAGANYQKAVDGVAALRLENERKDAIIAETKRQIVVSNAIQQRDSDRAQKLEKENERLQGLITLTPTNATKCFDDGLADRVFGRGSAPESRGGTAKHPAGAARRGGLRKGTN